MKLIDAEAAVEVKAFVFSSTCQFLSEIASTQLTIIQGALQLHVNSAAIMENAM